MFSKLHLTGIIALSGATALAALTAQAILPKHTLLTDSITPLSSQVSVLSAANPKTSIEFQVALKMRNLSKLQARIASGEQLSESQMVALYYPLKSDYQSLVQWLAAQGLKVRQTYANHLTVQVSGTTGQIQKILGVEFVNVSFKGRSYVAARTAPSLPQNLARFVLGINGLQTYQQAFPQNIVQTQTGNAPPYLISEIKKAYSATGLGVDGTNQKIAILINRFPLDSDLTKFWADNGIAQKLSNIEKVQVASSIPATPQGEETLDVEWTSGIARQSKVRIYAAGTLAFVNLDAAFQKIISDLPSQPQLNQLSISLGACEADISDSQKTTDSQFLATIASKKVTTFVSSGDDGSNGGCASGTGVDYFASDPSVTAVGGTRLTLASDGKVSSEEAWKGSGGGNSQFFNRPSWQKGSTVPAGTVRLVPDVALDADPKTGVYVVLRGDVRQFGGTSVSAPIWAGFSALINQARENNGKQPLGLLGPRIYKLQGTPNFRDITTGKNNGAFSAKPGYDQVTGLGVPVMNVLLPTLSQ